MALNSSRDSRNIPNNQMQKVEKGRFAVWLLGNRYVVYDQVIRNEVRRLIVQISDMDVYLDRMTDLRDSPLVSMLMRVPLVSSVPRLPLYMMTRIIRPICDMFLKNWVQESKAVGSAIVIVIPSAVRALSRSGVSLALSGLMIPKMRNVVSNISVL